MKTPLPTYKSFDEKSENFKIVKIDTMDAFKDMASQHHASQGIYRGISNASYKIYTSLQRRIIMDNLQDDFSKSAYIKAAREHKLLRKYFDFFKIVPSEISIFSYLQHYGAPTPLLDFTLNFHTALYFATEHFDSTKWVADKSINDYFSIFFINADDTELIAIPEVVKNLGQMKKRMHDIFTKYEDFSIEYLNEHIDTMFKLSTCEIFLINHHDEFLDIYNAYNNFRIIAQEGLFIYNSSPDVPLEKNLKKFFVDYARYAPSALDEIDHPSINQQRVEYELAVEKNKKTQARLAKNIITSYEIHKSLIDNIKLDLKLDRDSIYPNSERICSELFNQATQTSKTPA